MPGGVLQPRESSYHSKYDVLFDKKVNWMSFKPQAGLEVYPCYSCRDIFASRNSFLDHINRRGMVLKYKCSFCMESRTLTFYNPCSFLLHTRTHYNLLNGQINLEQLEISMLPYGLGGFLPDPNVELLYNVEDDSVGETNFINTRFYSPIQVSVDQQIINLISNDLLFIFSSEFNTPTTILVLKQISSNIPRCKFVILDNNNFIQIPNGTNINGKQILVACDNDTAIGNFHIKEEPLENANENNFEYNLPIITKIETISEPNDIAEHPNTHYLSGNENVPKCPECDEVQPLTMSQHFLHTNQPFQESLKCSICNYIAPTKCSLQAHTRIHGRSKPYVCPECGKDFKSWSLLQAHLEEVCFHLSKQVRLRCPGRKCGKIFAQTTTFCTHFIIHMQVLYKCTLCNETYTSNTEYIAHSETHDLLKEPSKQYKCTVCSDSNEIYNASNYQDHIVKHSTCRKQCLYVYNCKRCHSYFRSTLTYATHLLRCCKSITNQTITQHHGQKDCTTSDDRKRTHSNKALQIIGRCMVCKNQIGFKMQDFDNITVRCPNCGNSLTYNKSTSDLNGIIPISDEISDKGSCLLCQEKLCLSEMNNHFSLKRCKYQNPIVVLDVNINYEDYHLDDSFSKSDDSTKKKRRKILSSKYRKLSVSHSGVDVSTEAEEPTPFDGTYHCKLCNYNNAKREQFHEHIIQHRNVDIAYQCMECGECFVVKPSLVKHLLYYHQVNDIETYFNENSCFNRTAVEELEKNMRLAPGESKQPVKENQCRVCLQQFDDNLELSKHFRIHGMAFLLKNYK